MKKLSIRKYPELIKIWTADTISVFGDSIDSIAFMWLAYKLTGSSALMGMVMIFNMIPNILFGSFFGVIVDRFSKKPIAICSQLARGILVSLIAFLYFMNILEVWHLMAITFLISTFETLGSPANIVMYTKLVEDKRDMMELQGASSSLLQVSRLLGLASAGIIIGTFGISMGIFIDALTFFLSGMIYYFVKLPLEKKNMEKEVIKKSFFDDYKEGIKLIGTNRIILFILQLGLAVNFIVSPFNLLITLYSDRILKLGVKGISMINISLMFGMLIGSIFITAISKKIELKEVITGSLIFVSVSLFIIGKFPFLVSVLIGSFLLGISISGLNTSIGTMISTMVDMKFLGRVSSVMNSILLASTPISTGLIGFLGEKIKVLHIFLAMSFCIFVIVVGIGRSKVLSSNKADVRG